MNIWQFQSDLTRRLLIWSLLSMFIGVLAQIPRDRFMRGLGQQFTAWGFVDALIAIFGARAAQKRADQLPDPQSLEITVSESHKLRNILWVNTCLEVGYIAAGSILTLTKGKTN